MLSRRFISIYQAKKTPSIKDRIVDYSKLAVARPNNRQLKNLKDFFLLFENPHRFHEIFLKKKISCFNNYYNISYIGYLFVYRIDYQYTSIIRISIFIEQYDFKNQFLNRNTHISFFTKRFISSIVC